MRSAILALAMFLTGCSTLQPLRPEWARAAAMHQEEIARTCGDTLTRRQRVTVAFYSSPPLRGHGGDYARGLALLWAFVLTGSEWAYWRGVQLMAAPE